MENLQRRESHGAEQAAGGERPTGSVEGLVVDVNDVRVAHDFPRKFALIHVADAVGGEVGDVEFEDIATGLEEGGGEADAERKTPRGGDGLAVEDDAAVASSAGGSSGPPLAKEIFQVPVRAMGVAAGWR